MQMSTRRALAISLAAAAALTSLSCIHSSSGSKRDWKCAVASDTASYTLTVGCQEDFTALASQPLDASIPGAISLKSVIDRYEGDKVYFQNSKKYKIHHEFASAHLSVANGKAVVPTLRQFNEIEYYKPDRRFILGALTRYEGPKVWTYELSPYDNASADMIATGYKKMAEACFCGDSLYFHPTSKAVETEAAKLPATVKIIKTDKLYDGIDYQPLNYGANMGRLVFLTAAELEKTFVSFRDIVVLDAVPNDISVVSGIVTEEFQTPLSHINVLSQNRGTPNMGLRGAYTNATLRALANKWVKLEVGAFEWKVTEVTVAEADKWWDDNRPPAVGVPNLDTTVKDLRDIEKILDIAALGAGPAIKKAIPAFGGKTGHFAAFPHMDSTKLTHEVAFGIPIYYYWQHMEKNGLNDTLNKMLADSAFKADPAVRDARLEDLRDLIERSPVDSAFVKLLDDKMDLKFPGIDKIRFRSSTNAEDLDGFTGAGLYDSKTGSRTDPQDPILEAVTEVWASVWYFRAFEERSYRSIDHKAVGMSLLVHNAHPDEEANGVAITNNPFDPSGLEPGFYINVQKGGEPVVSPTAGIVADQFLYHYDMPGQPVVFLANSTLVPKGQTVLTAAQTHALGTALKEIHRFFQPIYGTDASKWFAMDTEFKLDQMAGDPDGEPVIIMKQARPYPGWGQR